MLKKYTTSKRIIFAAIIIPLMGFIAEWIASLHDPELLFLRGILGPVDFSWFGKGHFNPAAINYINLFFYLLLLTGGILYWVSGQKESRLIRFVFSIILISRPLNCVYVILYVLFSFKFDPGGIVQHLFTGVFYLLCQSGWIWLSYSVLKYFSAVKLPDTTESEHEDIVEISFIYASAGQRFFHLLIDNIISLALFSILTDQIIPFLEVQGFHVTYSKTGVCVALILFRGCYYIFFETLLGATPAKLLSETRVVTIDGERPPVASITGRTFARLLPLEGFSFFKGGSGWHDAVSDTMVVKERPDSWI